MSFFVIPCIRNCKYNVVPNFLTEYSGESDEEIVAIAIANLIEHGIENVEIRKDKGHITALCN